MPSLCVPLRIDAPIDIVCQPVTMGVPFPRGALMEPETLRLFDDAGKPIPLQTKPLARWPDGSVMWLLLDFLIDTATRGTHSWMLRTGADALAPAGIPLIVSQEANKIRVSTGTIECEAPTSHCCFDIRLLKPMKDWTTAVGWSGFSLSTVDKLEVEERGAVRATLRLQGFLTGQRCDYSAGLSFFAGAGLMRVRLTILNRGAASHKSGLWDLGDRGSRRFKKLLLDVLCSDLTLIRWTAEPGQPPQSLQGQAFEIGTARSSCPVVSVRNQHVAVTVAVPEYGQQFPRGIKVEGGCLSVGLFPAQAGQEFELQGGEQKTHTVWLHFGPPTDGPLPLQWVHRPAQVTLPAEWYEQAGVFPCFTPSLDSGEAGQRFASLMYDAIEGPDSFFAKREAIDEYGWRNYGELYADHENEHYPGPNPVVSHYNNQYDALYGLLMQFVRTGDRRWWELADPLARHVYDIDIYHTDRDKPAYNGGMFWHTDHYKDAATATHRAYSKANQKPGQPYGGGPSCEHNYTTGLLHYYYLTGDPLARAAVLSLAGWVIGMDDGTRTLLGVIDDGPTGLASRTRDDLFHGPGRGGGNSINALLDGWLLTGEARYLDKAEELIRRCVHPADDVAAHNLLDVENRWSYTVFLSVLCRYLDLKAEAGQVDRQYAYARAALLHYAEWMEQNERPYFDQLEKLEYPTETWAAQELRKGNVLRLAARHADEPLRERLWQRGIEFADRAWTDLFRFESRRTTRPLVLVMREGPVDLALRQHNQGVHTPRSPEYDFGRPEGFVPQKERVKRMMKSPRGLVTIGLRLLNPWRWWRYLRTSPR